MKIVNRTTGKVIDFTNIKTLGKDKTSSGIPQTRLEDITQAEQETPERIAKRGTIQQELGEQIRDVAPGGGKPGVLSQAKDIGLLGLNVASLPVQALESGIANPALQIQKAVPNPLAPDEERPTAMGLLGETAKGLTLQKRGKYEDVFRGAGLSEGAATAAGIGTSIAIPVGIFKKINKEFGTLSKAGDKNITKAGEAVIKSIKEAKKIFGPQVQKAWEPVVGFVADKTEFIKKFGKLPKAVQNKAREVFGGIDDIADDMPLEKLREFKRWIGKLRGGTFGKAEKGAIEKIDDMNIDSMYRTIKNTIRETVEGNVPGEAGKKLAKGIDDVEEVYSEFMNATQFLKKTLVDPTLKKATKGGALAGKMVKKGDTTARTAMNTVKGAGGNAKKYMNQAVDRLNKFNSDKAIASTIKRLVGAATIGATAGAVGRGLFGGRGGGEGLIDIE